MGVEFVKDKETKEPLDFNFSAEIASYCFDKGIIITGGVQGSADGVNGDALQIAPPFIINEEEIDVIVKTVEEAIEFIMSRHGIKN